MMLEEMLRKASDSPAATARDAGVSRSTLFRIVAGSTEPRLSTLREIALALGLDVSLDVQPAHDPAAARAAMVAFGQVEDDDPAVLHWLERFERWGITDQPDILAARAGKLAAPLLQPGAVHYGWRAGVDAVAVMASCARGDWALSGAPAAELLVDGPVKGPGLMWCTETQATCWEIDRVLHRVNHPAPAGVSVVPVTAGWQLHDVHVDGPWRWACPVQVVLDLHGMGRADLARRVSAGWED